MLFIFSDFKRDPIDLYHARYVSYHEPQNQWSDPCDINTQDWVITSDWSVTAVSNSWNSAHVDVWNLAKNQMENYLSKADNIYRQNHYVLEVI